MKLLFPSWTRIILYVLAVLIGFVLGFVVHLVVGREKAPEAPFCTLPAEVRINTPAYALEADSNGPVEWFFPDPGINVLFKPNDKTVILSASKGSYRVYGYTAKGNKASSPSLSKLYFDTTPGPDPGPKPPDPGPGPVPIEGNAVLMVYETADLPKLTEAQRQILYSQEIRKYLDQKCGTDKSSPNGKAWRIWDQHQDLTGEVDFWKNAMARPRSALPWIWINGKKAYGGPMPATPGETLNLLKGILE